MKDNIQNEVKAYLIMPSIDIKGKAIIISQNLINKFYKYLKYRIGTINKKAQYKLQDLRRIANNIDSEKEETTMRETRIQSPEKGMVTHKQYCCLENPMDRGAWQTTVHGVTKSQTRLSDSTLTFTMKKRTNEIREVSCAKRDCVCNFNVLSPIEFTK